MLRSVRNVPLGWSAKTYQLDDANWVGLLGLSFGVEEKPLASLASMGCSGMGSLWLLLLKVRSEVIGGDGFILQVEKFLRRDETERGS